MFKTVKKIWSTGRGRSNHWPKFFGPIWPNIWRRSLIYLFIFVNCLSCSLFESLNPFSIRLWRAVSKNWYNVLRQEWTHFGRHRWLVNINSIWLIFWWLQGIYTIRNRKVWNKLTVTLISFQAALCSARIYIDNLKSK